jgi:hypothetical protein
MIPCEPGRRGAVAGVSAGGSFLRRTAVAPQVETKSPPYLSHGRFWPKSGCPLRTASHLVASGCGGVRMTSIGSGSAAWLVSGIASRNAMSETIQNSRLDECSARPFHFNMSPKHPPAVTSLLGQLVIRAATHKCRLERRCNAPNRNAPDGLQEHVDRTGKCGCSCALLHLACPGDYSTAITSCLNSTM